MIKLSNKYAFYVSGMAGRLKKLLNHAALKPYLNQVKIVITDNASDRELEVICTNKHIKLCKFDCSNIDKKMRNQLFSDYLLDCLTSHRVDYCFVYGERILVGDLLEQYKNRLINFHPSLLPSFKGRAAVDQAIKSKAFLFGNTAHFVVNEIDGGPIIMQNIMHQKYIQSIDYILDKQVVMQFQIIKWLNGSRIHIKDGLVNIVDGNYTPDEYIPNIDSETVVEFN